MIHRTPIDSAKTRNIEKKKKKKINQTLHWYYVSMLDDKVHSNDIDAMQTFSYVRKSSRTLIQMDKIYWLLISYIGRLVMFVWMDNVVLCFFAYSIIYVAFDWSKYWFTPFSSCFMHTTESTFLFSFLLMVSGLRSTFNRLWGTHYAIIKQMKVIDFIYQSCINCK